MKNCDFFVNIFITQNNVQNVGYYFTLNRSIRTHFFNKNLEEYFVNIPYKKWGLRIIWGLRTFANCFDWQNIGCFFK